MSRRSAERLFVQRLASFGDRVALKFESSRAVSYRDLMGRVDVCETLLGPDPRLVLLTPELTLQSIVTYLAALQAGHPVILAPGHDSAGVDALASTFDVDVVVDGSGVMHERHKGPRLMPMHRDLAVMLSTSGIVGEPKLVRLSRGNLEANASSITRYLGLRPPDIGALSLPLHHSYGLSVLNAHLSVGAALAVCPRPVDDPRWLDWMTLVGCTNIAGVPETFDTLERIGFRSRSMPALRMMTVAGARCAPEIVRLYADHLSRRGGRFFAMYGQTEATARIAYLPPEAAKRYPDCIGIPIPDGELYLTDAEGRRLPDLTGTKGELTYRGPNVMMGYATAAFHLGKGSEVEELRTGDLAERIDVGFYRLTGRRERFSKLSGQRISHDAVEHRLEAQGIAAAVTGDDTRIIVAVRDAASVQPAADLVMSWMGQAAGHVAVMVVSRVPRLPTGKVDYRALARLAGAAEPSGGRAETTPQDYGWFGSMLRKLGSRRVGGGLYHTLPKSS